MPTYHRYRNDSNSRCNVPDLGERYWCSSVDCGDYKLIVFLNDNQRELYNLKEDIGEKKNLAGEMPELVDELHRELKRWWQELDARFPDGYAPH